ncbi:MAG: glycosyltransferase family 2 protein [Gemmataceae bacterium]|nr:glycosyltransferase family 2 protein [Gemmataceae bacterium]
MADLSVVVANYNHARYLPRALDAILSQSPRPREVVVIDDASDRDDSWAVIERYARRDPLIRPVRHAVNRGVCPTFNEGLAAARGEYVVLAAADDVVLPGFFERAAVALAAHPSAGLCCGYDSYRRGADGPVVPNPSGWGDEPTYFGPPEVARRVRCNLAAHATVARRAALLAAGGYRPELAWYSDWFAYLVVAFRHGLVHVPAPLAVRTLDLPGAYSGDDNRRGPRNVAALAAFLDLATGPAFADVAPYFVRSGAATYFGPDLVRAAARRPDPWRPDVLALLVGLLPEHGRELLADPDPVARDLALYLLGPQREAAEARYAAELEQARAEADALRRHFPPPGVGPKLRWLAGKAVARVVRAAG